jgi:FeS assembly SUF system protein
MGFFSKLLGGSEPELSTAAADDREVVPDDAPPVVADTPSGWDLRALQSPPAAAADTPTIEGDPAVTAELRPRVIETLKTVFDPEIPVDIYELGLIYDIVANNARHVHVVMTLTSPACPSAQQLPSEVRFKVKALEGVSDATVDIVWEPPWDKERMSETAKLTLGLF